MTLPAQSAQPAWTSSVSNLHLVVLEVFVDFSARSASQLVSMRERMRSIEPGEGSGDHFAYIYISKSLLTSCSGPAVHIFQHGKWKGRTTAIWTSLYLIYIQVVATNALISLLVLSAPPG